ncbi:phosphoribosylglycinamide synthetase C domain-containing protein [Mesorhizobium sp. M0040]|uniref:phosphoribosylglycinamide synthetase C domain-containing protein n=1 Tax=Mesorhizobium sp. M0040 TaxID=2956855 RepID=UPI003337650F
MQCNGRTRSDGAIGKRGPRDQLPRLAIWRFSGRLPHSGLQTLDRRNCRLFLANVRRDAENRLVSAGGRVLHVTGIGKNYAQAVHHASANIEKIHFERISNRSDIGVIYDLDALRHPRGTLPRQGMGQIRRQDAG